MMGIASQNYKCEMSSDWNYHGDCNEIECLTWIFGRGASVSCGLNWTVSDEIKKMPRDKQINCIKTELRKESQKDTIDTSPYRKLLKTLSLYTNKNWHHYFITTNWDNLLETEIQKLGLSQRPKWLVDSFVFHLNGTIEDAGNNHNRSPFLLETDPASFRKQSIEGNYAFNHLIWQRFIITVGLSFSCETDKSLLYALNKIEDELPIGEATWLIIDRNGGSLHQVECYLKGSLPAAKIQSIVIDFKKWIDAGMLELKQLKIIS